jgi:inosine/xanthosine triphosphate pyrophosphatase family protein
MRRVAFEFETQDELDEYLRQHPNADKSNHWVNNENDVAPSAEKVDESVALMVSNPKARKSLFGKASERLRAAGASVASAVFETVKSEVDTYKRAGSALVGLAQGKTPSREDTLAIASTAVTMAGLALAVSTGGLGAVASYGAARAQSMGIRALGSAVASSAAGQVVTRYVQDRICENLNGKIGKAYDGQDFLADVLDVGEGLRQMLASGEKDPDRLMHGLSRYVAMQTASVLDEDLPESLLKKIGPKTMKTGKTLHGAGIMKSARSEVFSTTMIEKFRKDTLMIAKAAESVQDLKDIELVTSSIRSWRDQFDYFTATLRSDLVNRLRQANNAQDPEYNPNPPDKNDAEAYLNEALKPMWEFATEFGRAPSGRIVLRDFLGNTWVEPEIAFEETVQFFIDRNFASNRKDAEDMAHSYYKTRPLYGRAEAEAIATNKWKEEARKWARRLRDKARPTWEILDRYSKWLESWRGGKSTLTVVTPEEEVVPLSGFRVVFRGFADSPYQKDLPAVREGLDRFRKLAADRAPILLKHVPPIIIEWTYEPLTNSNHAAYYTGGKVFITPWVIGDNLENFVKTLAHEIGHYLIERVLPKDAVADWYQFIKQDYKKLDLREALKELEASGARDFSDRKFGDANPILYLQIATLWNDRTYRDYNLNSARRIRQYLAEGRDPLVYVPTRPITGYAGKSPDEAFCEAIGMLVGYGPHAVIDSVLGMLRSVTGGGVKIASAQELASAYFGRTAAARPKYKGKKRVPKATGEGTTTVYQYGPRQIQKRHQEKADRIDQLQEHYADLRAKVKRDLESSVDKTRLTALAVALIDCTFERVGNPESAAKGHFGVTGWKKSHITPSKDGKKLTIKYVGKSGVKHEKVVDDPDIVAAVKDALEGKGEEDNLLSAKDLQITSRQVNEYLSPFDITGKDIRGLHANRETQWRLKEIRSKGPELPRARKERDKILKDEFAEALEGAAAAVGHEPTTLRNQYLVPGLEDTYLKDGTVLDKLASRKASLVTVWGRTASDDGQLYLNTSNPNKLREFQQLGLSDLQIMRKDLPEPDADPLTVIRSKASQIGPNVLVEDTSFDVEGADVGVNVKWMLGRIEEFVGRRATFRVLIGLLRGGQVEVYEGVVEGTIVPPRGEGFGFDPVFLPDGARETLAESKPPRFNARALAVAKFKSNRPRWVLDPLPQWEGKWQGKTATKTPAEKMDAEAARLSRPVPNEKPPRKDLRRERVQVDDPDLAQPKSEQKDMSLNYKDNG